MKWTLTLFAVAASLFAGVASAAPDIQHWTTDNGTPVYFVAARELPIVDVRLVFDAGAARDDGKPGLAMLTNSLLLEGTDSMDAGAVARRFERYGARVHTDSRRDSAFLHVRSLSRQESLDPVVDHLVDVLGHPAFAADAVERVRRQMLVGLRQDLQSPDTVADRAFARALYGDHPYANPPEGTQKGLKAITRDDIRAFHKRYYTAGNAVIAIVGDLDESAARAMADRLSGALPSGKAAPPLPKVTMPDSARTVRVPFDSSQTHVLIGQPVIARGDPDYYPLYVANQVLGGGGLVSVLAKEMREKRGLSYSTYSAFMPAARKGRFELGTQVRNSALGEARKVLTDTLASFRKNGPTEQQLQEAKQNITGSFPLNLDSNRELVRYVAMIGFYGLPLDYLDKFRDRIETLTRQQVADAFRRRVDPARMVTVLVGPADVIADKGSD